MLIAGSVGRMRCGLLTTNRGVSLKFRSASSAAKALHFEFALDEHRSQDAWIHASGRPVSGYFEVSEGLITVTSSDGTKTTADIQESMLSTETLARMLLLQMHQTKHSDAKSEDALED